MPSPWLEGGGAYTHNGDHELLESLGLRTWNFERAWTPLGTVVVQDAEPDGEYGPRPATTVDVAVSALPAQFWRFTITRPRDDCETVNGKVRGIYTPLEHFVMTTGSGAFGTYWPMAKALAKHMINVETPDA
jgi:hypothetical protein